MIGFVPATNDTYVERELLVYPWTSLVAEFGGTLSLFLGLSFMSLWDGVHILGRRPEVEFVRAVTAGGSVKFLPAV